MYTAPARAQAGIPYLAEPDDTDDSKTAAETAPAAQPSAKPGVPEVTPPAAPTPAPPAPPPEPAPGRPVSFFAELWGQRRAALQQGDADAAQKTLIDLQRAKNEAGWPDFFAYADALVLESKQALAKGNAQMGMRLATAAAALAPHRPSPHFAVGRAAWASGGGLITTLAAFGRGMYAGITEPAYLRVNIGNVLLALVIASLLVVAFLALVVLYRHGRLLLHDLQHLLPRAASSVHASLLGTTLLLAPVFLRQGFLWIALVWLAVLALYYDTRERVGVLVVLAALCGFALGLPYVLSHIGYAGSRSQDVYLTVRDAGAVAAAERVRARQHLGPEELYALGLRARWSGQITEAQSYLDRATAILEDSDLLVCAGNVRYFVGDRAGAIAAFERALLLDSDNLSALFNLSRVYYAMTEHQKAGDAQRRAMSLDLDRVEHLNDEAKRSRGIYLVDNGVPRRLLDVPLELGSAHWRTVAQLWRLVGGETRRLTFAMSTLAVMALVFVLGLMRRVVHPASRCPRCGHAACQHCHPSLPDQTQCIRCYHAFVNHENVDPAECIQQEIQVHRHRARQLRTRQFLSLLLAGSSQMLRGAFLHGVVLMTLFVSSLLALFWAIGLLPEIVPLDAGPHWLTAILAGLVALATYALALIDGIREER